MSPPKTSSNMILEGRQYLTINHFVAAGDEIPLHTHEIAHISLCISGICEVFDDTGKTVVIMPGNYVEFAIGRPHGLRARIDGTVVVNIGDVK